MADSAEEVTGCFAFSYPDQPVPISQKNLSIFHGFEISKCINNCVKCCCDQDQPEGRMQI